MKSNVKIIAGDILNAEENAIIVPCSTRSTYSGAGVDGAIYKKYPVIRERWNQWLRAKYKNCAMDFGDTFVTKEDGKVFVLVAVPPMNEKNYYYCNLETCFSNAFGRALDVGCSSIACPLIGTGGLNWTIGEAFFSLYDVLAETDDPRLISCGITVYLKNEEAIEYARKNNWDISMCFDETPIDNRIKFLSDSGYEYSESQILRDWYAMKEKKKRDNKKGKQAENATRFLLAAEAANQFRLIGKNAEKPLREADIARRSGLDKNLVSYIFSCNRRAYPDKDQMLAFCYAMQCSFATMCRWLKMLGLCLTDSERDKFIADAFLKRTSSDVKYLNIRLKNRGFPPLMTSASNTERAEFAERINAQIKRIRALGGDDISSRELARKSGMSENDISLIRNASTKFVPKKDKIIALAAALRCSTKQLAEWLKIFGMALSEDDRDAIIHRAFDERTVRDANELNALLLEHGQQHLKTAAFSREQRIGKAVE